MYVHTYLLLYTYMKLYMYMGNICNYALSGMTNVINNLKQGYFSIITVISKTELTHIERYEVSFFLFLLIREEIYEMLRKFRKLSIANLDHNTKSNFILFSILP